MNHLRFLPLLFVALLTGCNLSASLLGDGNMRYAINYEHTEQEHSMDVAITLTDGIITEIEIEPSASTARERAHQLAFASNIRQYLLTFAPADVILPPAVGVGANAMRLTRLFQEQIVDGW